MSDIGKVEATVIPTELQEKAPAPVVQPLDERIEAAHAKGFFEGKATAKEELKASVAYDPHTNPKVISVIQQEDGNWTAEGTRFGNMVRVRGASPHTVLQGLLTHDGKVGNQIV